VLPLVVAFFEGADGDVAVLPKPLIFNPAGTEGQVLINGLVGIYQTVVQPRNTMYECASCAGILIDLDGTKG